MGWVGLGAGWSSPVARWAHNPKVAGSNPAPATSFEISDLEFEISFAYRGRSSAGRAPRLQRGGQGFESPRLHQNASRSLIVTQKLEFELEQSEVAVMAMKSSYVPLEC